MADRRQKDRRKPDVKQISLTTFILTIIAIISIIALIFSGLIISINQYMMFKKDTITFN